MPEAKEFVVERPIFHFSLAERMPVPFMTVDGADAFDMRSLVITAPKD